VEIYFGNMMDDVVAQQEEIAMTVYDFHDAGCLK
jgi:hypothetical protein